MTDLYYNIYYTSTLVGGCSLRTITGCSSDCPVIRTSVVGGGDLGVSSCVGGGGDLGVPSCVGGGGDLGVSSCVGGSGDLGVSSCAGGGGDLGVSSCAGGGGDLGVSSCVGGGGDLGVSSCGTMKSDTTNNTHIITLTNFYIFTHICRHTHTHTHTHTHAQLLFNRCAKYWAWTRSTHQDTTPKPTDFIIMHVNTHFDSQKLLYLYLKVCVHQHQHHWCYADP